METGSTPNNSFLQKKISFLSAFMQTVLYRDPDLELINGVYVFLPVQCALQI